MSIRPHFWRNERPKFWRSGSTIPSAASRWFFIGLSNAI